MTTNEVVVKPRKTRVIWSEEATKVLTDMFHAGCDMEEMILVLQRPYASIRAKLVGLKLKMTQRCPVPNYDELDRIMAERGYQQVTESEK